MLKRVLSAIAIGLALAFVVLAALLIAPAAVVEFAAGILLPSLAVLQLGLLGLAVVLLYLAARLYRPPRAVISSAIIVCAAIAVATAWRELRYYARETVRIPDGDMDFEATLYRPRQASSDRLSAVLILHGSGPSRRGAYHFIAHRFAKAGYAVLNVDKRGVGGSEGTYYGDDLGRDSVIERRARDARVALQYLARRSDIDAARIGVVSLSQGGWVAPLLLTGDAPARYAINLSGPAISSHEEGEWSEWTNEDADHFGLRPPPEPFEKLDERIRGITPAGFDPRPHLRRMQMPSLWLFGEWDSSLPTRASVRVLDSVAGEGNPLTVRVFPQANHGLMVVRGPNGSRLANFAPGVWDTVFAWTARAGISGAR